MHWFGRLGWLTARPSHVESDQLAQRCRQRGGEGPAVVLVEPAAREIQARNARLAQKTRNRSRAAHPVPLFVWLRFVTSSRGRRVIVGGVGLSVLLVANSAVAVVLHHESAARVSQRERRRTQSAPRAPTHARTQQVRQSAQPRKFGRVKTNGQTDLQTRAFCSRLNTADSRRS